MTPFTPSLLSLECSSVCVVNGQGKIEREAKVASEPDALIAWFAALEVPCNTSLNFMAPASINRATFRNSKGLT
ncbi:MAG: hypothetical protein EOR68_32070 [Mesorhizobium sp.]|nr:MAG: hypothetical protein EOR68_32070 [Mesorhizobium sp.]TIP47818.1 MAG: hypothetical protein E5X77_14425 [Mesorhizobium sp.]TJV67802.1 MAG: hypothetical protein E5X76_32345 [Mesorhizobium sp.]